MRTTVLLAFVGMLLTEIAVARRRRSPWFYSKFLHRFVDA